MKSNFFQTGKSAAAGQIFRQKIGVKSFSLSDSRGMSGEPDSRSSLSVHKSIGQSRIRSPIDSLLEEEVKEMSLSKIKT